MNKRHRLWLQSGKEQSVLLDQLLALIPHCEFEGRPQSSNDFTRGETVER